MLARPVGIGAGLRELKGGRRLGFQKIEAMRS